MLALSVLAGMGVAMADDGGSSGEQTGHTDESEALAPVTADGKHLKLDGVLAAAAITAASAGDDAALAAAGSVGAPVAGSALRVVVESTSMDLTAARTAILAAGGTIEAEYADTIQALLLPSALEAVASSSDVRYVRLPAVGVPGRSPGTGVGR
jgi:hypothetical protein